MNLGENFSVLDHCRNGGGVAIYYRMDI